MTIELTSEQEAMVLRLAEESGKTPEELVATALSELEWVDDPHEQRILAERIAEADRGDSWVSHEEVGRRLGLIPTPR